MLRNRRAAASSALLTAAVAAATWDGWRWLLTRLHAAPEEGVSLAVAILVLAAAGVSERSAGAPSSAPGWPMWLVPLAALTAYAVLWPWLPGIARAALAVATTLATLHATTLRTSPPLALWGLVALALPVLPSLQMTFGLPMRIVSAEATVVMLAFQGLAVTRQGTMLLWQDRLIQFDAPCAGVAMLWAGVLMALTVALWLRLSAVRTLAAIAVAVGAVFIANVMRATSLFYVEAGLLGATPAWWHEAIGLAAFAMAMAAALPAMLWLAPAGPDEGAVVDRPASEMGPGQRDGRPVTAGTGVGMVFGVVAGGLAAGMPVLMPWFAPGTAGRGEVAAAEAGFPGWPTTIDGRPVLELPLSPREAAFGRDFPGRIGRFTDGEREIVVRWVASATRKLHPAGDCLRGVGYRVTPAPAHRDSAGRPMGCLTARKGAERFTVCERIDEATRDRLAGVSPGHAARASWPDVSSWYWAALWGTSSGPWWSYAIATPAPTNG